MKFIDDLEFIIKTSNPNSKVSIISFIDHLILNTGYQATVLYRISNFFYRNRIPVLHRLFNYLGRLITGSDISYSATIDGGLLISHGMGVIIGSNVFIGKNVKLMNDITVGSKWARNGKDGQPIIGNNVSIGVGARILGPVKIGNNVIIGANAVVLKDVPDNCIAVGIPAKIISKEAIFDEKN